MSAEVVTTIRCDHPGCDQSFAVGGPRGLEQPPMPRGWWRGGRFLRAVHACPDHAAEARRVERALYAHGKRECAARNAWLRANPAPSVPTWLEALE